MFDQSREIHKYDPASESIIVRSRIVQYPTGVQVLVYCESHFACIAVVGGDYKSMAFGNLSYFWERVLTQTIILSTVHPPAHIESAECDGTIGGGGGGRWGEGGPEGGREGVEHHQR